MSIGTEGHTAAQADELRQQERRAFDLATTELLFAKRTGRGDLGALASALDANRRLWDLLLVDCALETNGLPNVLRAEIVSLALWVARHTSLVLRGDGDIDALIEVNRAVAGE
jgi:flagellar protein FlaF